jgi:hypothetical protein
VRVERHFVVTPVSGRIQRPGATIARVRIPPPLAERVDHRIPAAGRSRWEWFSRITTLLSVGIAVAYLATHRSSLSSAMHGLRHAPTTYWLLGSFLAVVVAFSAGGVHQHSQRLFHLQLSTTFEFWSFVPVEK